MNARISWLWTVAVALACASACNDGPAAPTVTAQPLGSAEMAAIALDSDELVDDVINDELSVMASSTLTSTTVSVTRNRPCPAGGEIVVDATLQRSFDSSSGVMEARLVGSRTRNDCAFDRQGHRITVNGSTNLDAQRRRVWGVPDGLQVTHYSGSLHALRDDGEERFCEFDLTVVRDPDARSVTLSGVLCGDAVNVVRSWSQGG